MRTLNLFGKDVPIREYGCKSMEMDEPLYIKKERVNLFIQVDNKCNANCRFCEFHGENKSFNLDKLSYVIKYISNRAVIGKLNFTGGEPTLDLGKFDEVVSCTKESIDWNNKPEVTLNTNGIHLLEILKYEDYLDSIGLSRHHYFDNINNEIFNCDTVSNSEKISIFQNKVKNKNLVQLRCNVILGYIDNAEEVEKYLNHAISLGVYDCGFVTLMPINNFCNNHQINFYDMLNGVNNIIKVNGWTRMESGRQVCECGNYVYCDDKGYFCKFYNRYFNHCDLNDGLLVFDGQNLRIGFGGDVIY